MSSITGTVIFSFPTTEWNNAGKPLPFITTYNQLVLSPTTEFISGTYTIVSVPFLYDNGIPPTGDGLSYSDPGFSGFLSNTDQDLTQFGDVPLSPSGSQFANYKGTIGINPGSVTATLGTPTILGTSLYRAFYETTCDFNLSSWDVSAVTNMDSTFENSSINNSLNSWDVSNVENMNRTFYGSIYNQPLNNWNVSSVWGGNGLGFTSTFAFSAFNQNISDWTLMTATLTKKLWSMAFMFESSAYNQPLTWNFNITTLPFSTIEGMFKNAAFNQNIGSWDVSGIDNMTNMFDNCAINTNNFNSLLNGWNTNLSTPTHSVSVGSIGLTYSSTGLPGWNGLIANNITFPDASLVTESFVFTIKTSEWDGSTYPLITTDSQLVLGVVTIDTSTITDYSIVTIPYTFTDNGTTEDGLYYNGFAYNSVAEQDITSFGGIPLSRKGSGDTFRNYKGTMGQYSTTASVTLGVPTIIGTSMNYTFLSTTFDADISAWDVSNVTSMVHTFNNSQFNTSIDNWNVSNVTDMNAAFFNSQYNEPLNSWNVSNVTSMEYMFNGSQFNKSISNWDVSALTTTGVENMFASSQFNQPLDNFANLNTYSIKQMFYKSQFNQDISNWNISNISNFDGVFRESVFNQDISTWNVSNVNLMNSTFLDATQFNQDLSSWNLSNISQMANMLDNCGLNENNYDLLLNGWANNINTPDTIILGANGLTYSASGKVGRDILTGTKNWTINGDQQILSNFVFTIKTSEWDGSTYPLITDGGQLALGVVTIDTSTITDYSIVTIPYSFTDDGTTDDGLYYNGLYYNSVVEQDITSFDGIPLSRTNDGNTFQNYKGTMGQYSTAASVTLGVPTIIGTKLNNTFNNTTFNTDISNWDVSNVVSLNNAFASSKYTQPLNNWDVSNVTNFSYLFYDCDFNNDVNNWDVSNATNFEGVFFGSKLFDKPLNNWGTKLTNVTTMKSMFSHTKVFNQDLNSWDVSNVSDLRECFSGALLFNGNISSWVFPNVTNLSQMFNNATDFNQDISGWTITNITDTNQMFSRASSFNQDISGWNVSKVENMHNMFNEASSFNQDISGWDVSNVTDMHEMFRKTTLFNQPLNTWDVIKVTNINGMFVEATSFNQNINNWDTTTITSMNWVFYGATSFNQPLNNWNVSNVSDMENMFQGATQFNQDISGWNTNNVNNMYGMFKNASAFNQDISGWNYSQIYNMMEMLDNCGLSEINYDLLLNSFVSNTNDYVPLGANGLIYSINGKDARDILVTTKNWTITGDQYIPCFHETTTVLCLFNGKEEYKLITELKVGDFVKTYKDGYRKVKMTHTYKCTNLPENELNRFYVMDKSVNSAMTHDLIITGGHSILVNECDMTDDNIQYMNKCKMKYLVVQDKRKELACINSNFVGKSDGSVEDVYVLVLDNNDVEKVYGIFVNGGVLVESSSQTVCKKQMDKTNTIKSRKFKLC